MPNLLAITRHNAVEHLSNPLLHETVIAGMIQFNTWFFTALTNRKDIQHVPGLKNSQRQPRRGKPRHRAKTSCKTHILQIIATQTMAAFQAMIMAKN